MINQNNFLIKDFEVHHPASLSYRNYWAEQKRRSIEGYWVSGRWMPGKLYFYVNMATILLNKRNSKVKFYGRPNLRDLEWSFFPIWEEARGFSGFEEDTEVSCHRLLLEYDEDSKDILKELYPNEYPYLIKPDGTLKTYERAKDYIGRSHDTNLGRPMYRNQSMNLMMLGPRGFGKDLHKDTLLWYEDGERPISQVKIGDRIYDWDGRLTTVSNVFKFTDQLQYEITLRDGRKIKCGAGHRWRVEERQHDGTYITKVKELHEILKDYKYGKRGDSKYFIRLSAPIKYRDKSLPLDPYTLGVLLGDGGLTQGVRFTTADKEILDYLVLPEGSEINKISSSKYQYSIKGTKRNGKHIYNPVLNILSELGLIGKKSTEKVIPEIYMRGSFEQRLNLLRGLMDTDGYISKSGNITFDQSNQQLANQVKKLCETLGIRCTLKIRKTSNLNSYRLNIITSYPIFKLERKLQRLNTTQSVYAYANRERVAIIDIKPTIIEDSYCISVDNRSSIFLAGDCIPTHNSYTVGCGIVAPEFLLDGKTSTVVDETKKRSSSVTIVGAADAKYSNDLLSKTKITLDNLPGSVELNGLYYPSPMSKKYKGSLQPGRELISSYKVKIGGNWKTSGSGSEIKNRTFKDNPYAIQGTRASTVVYEEAGMFSNLRDSYNHSVDVMKDGSDKFGSAMFLGTGGDMGAGTIDAYYMFYNPHEFDMIAFDDLWEFKKQIGYFVPAHYGDNAYKDDQGNTRVEFGLKREQEMRAKLAGDKGVSSTLDSYIVYHPLIPSEMFLVRNTNIFPVLELRRRKQELDESSISNLLEKRVELFFDPKATTTNGVNYKLDIGNKLKPIREFPYKGDDREGALIVYELPILDDKTGKVPENLYIIGHDPVRTDSPDGPSLASIYVIKTKKYKYKHGHDEIVAQFVGRPHRGRNVTNELLLKLALFYNAKVYFENSVGNVKEYFEKHHALGLLATQPKTVFTNKASYEQNSSVQVYGYPMEGRRNKLDALNYVADWLLEERGMDNSGKVKRNLDLIPDPALLSELIFFNLDGNFDRVMGFAGCIIGLEETHNQYEEQILSKAPKSSPIIDFFNNNKTLFTNVNSYKHALPFSEAII